MFKTILLLEDDVSHALLIKRALRTETSEILHFETVGALLQTLITFTELDAVIISDLRLPDSDGISHVGKIAEAKPFLPILVLTSSTALSDAVNALKLGARDYLVKDFNAEFSNALRLSLARLYTASELEREKRELLRDLNILRYGIESSADALAVLSRDGEVQYSNSSFSLFTKLLSEKKTFFSGFDNFEKGDEFSHTLIEVSQTLPAKGSWIGECFHKETQRSFEITIIGSSDANALVVWVRDKTETKKREKFQKDLLSTTTHDLKGPLGAIRISSEMLRGMLPQGEKPFELALRISSSVQNSLNLIDGFLSARRIQEGNLRLKTSELNIVELVEDIISENAPVAAARGVSLRGEFSEAKILCDGDPQAFRRVLSNLISNAIKFTPKNGEIIVFVSHVENEVVFEVKDSGSGMEPSQVQTLFERFSRLDKHSAIEGTGLGLFVVKNLVSAHGGEIRVRSEPGLGTSFKIILPKKPPVNENGELVGFDFN